MRVDELAGAVIVWLAIGLLVAAAGDVVLNVLFAILQGQGINVVGPSLVTLMAAFGIAFLELAVLAAFVAMLVVLFRSLIAGVIPAFLLAIGSTLLQLYLGADADRLPLPSYAAQALRDGLLGQGPSAPAFLGLAVLTAWVVILTGLGLLVFSRQQLASE